MTQTDSNYKLDDKYTDGIWYDQMNGDFAKVQESADGEMVELVNPENGNVYWDMPVSEWVESEQQDFRQVSEEAVQDPVATVNRALRLLSRNDINELASVPLQEEIDLRYAREQVSIES
jgi:hypothetical protein